MAAVRRNVQQQNAYTRAEIVGTAETFRTNPLGYPWLFLTLHDRGLDPSSGILARLRTVQDQNQTKYDGCWVTSDRRFIQFEVEIAYGPATTDNVRLWVDVTDSIVISAHQRGIGKSFGWLALDVLQELSLR